MTISDPAQLLTRIPELELFSDDPAIVKAIESGDPFKVYRALVWAKIRGRHPAHRTTLKMLVKNRRLFSKPLKGVPSLSTINSVGFSFVGESERDQDGSYIALHAVVILFAIPVIPLGSYLVSKTGSRQWKIYTKVPIGIVGWLYSRGLALFFLLAILGGAANSWHKSRTQDLMVLNGFSSPLDVVVGAQSQTIPAGGRTVFNVPVGDITGQASSAGVGKIEDFHQVISSHAGYSIWNVAGAAPLFLETVNYYKTQPTNKAPNPQTVYCGQRYVELAKVDFGFVEPAQTVSMDKYSSQASRTYLDVAHPSGRKQSDLCMGYLYSKNASAELVTVYAALAQLDNWDYTLTANAVYFAGSVSTADAIRQAKQAATARPDNIDLQRLYQITRDGAGEFDSMLQEYKSRAAQQPESATAQYLYAALLEGSEGRAAMEQLANQFNQSPAVLRSLAWRRDIVGDYIGEIDAYTRLKQISTQDAFDVLDNHIEALVAQHRSTDALHEVEESFQNNTRKTQVRDAGSYALIAQLSGVDPDKLIAELERNKQDKNTLDLIRVRAGYASKHNAAENLPGVNLALALRDNPSQALQIADTTPPYELGVLQEEQLALLYCEAIHNNDLTLVGRLQKIVQMTSADQQFLKQYIAGNAVSFDTTNLPLPYRAAADFARSRNPSLPLAEQAQLRQRANQEDVLHTVISTALNHWPT